MLPLLSLRRLALFPKIRTQHLHRSFSNEINSNESLYSLSRKILLTPDPTQKAHLTQQTKELWSNRKIPLSNSSLHEQVPTSPTLPEFPKCVPSVKMPNHKESLVPLPVYLMHSIAHVEVGAINMVWDMLSRFKGEYPMEYYDDWVTLACDESRHFLLLNERLKSYGSSYGQLLAHDSLWKNAEMTSNDLLGRIALMQLVEEARALDAHPRLLSKVGSGGDKESMSLIDMICREEVGHVNIGIKWFSFLCQLEGKEPKETFRSLFRKYFPNKRLIPPFNFDARKEAGMESEWYLDLSSIPNSKELLK